MTATRTFQPYLGHLRVVLRLVVNEAWSRGSFKVKKAVNLGTQGEETSLIVNSKLDVES